MGSRVVVMGAEEWREGRTNDWSEFVAGPQSAAVECTQWLYAVFAVSSTWYPVAHEVGRLVVEQMLYSTPVFGVYPAHVGWRVSSSRIHHLRFARSTKPSIQSRREPKILIYLDATQIRCCGKPLPLVP